MRFFKKFWTQMEKENTIVIGLADTGKTQTFVKQKLLYADSSYIVIDREGEMLSLCGDYLKEKGYNVKILNPSIKGINITNKYNPFSYVKKEEDLNKMVKYIVDMIAQIKIKDMYCNLKDPYYLNLIEIILLPVVHFIYEGGYDLKGDVYNKNLKSIFDIFSNYTIVKNNERANLNILFEKYIKNNPNSNCNKYYKKYKTCVDFMGEQDFIRCEKDIIIRLGHLCHIYESVLKEDDLKLEDIDKEKYALFIVADSTNYSNNVIIPLIISQISNILLEKNELINPVNILLDDFCDIGKIKEMNMFLIKSNYRNLYYTVVCQNFTQIIKIYNYSYFIECLDAFDSICYFGQTDFSSKEELEKYMKRKNFDFEDINYLREHIFFSNRSYFKIREHEIHEMPILT